MRRALICILVAAGVLLVSPEWARSATASPDLPALDDYMAAERALRDGHVEQALQTLEAAARRGGVRAQLKLGKIYAEGKIVPRDEVKACHFYGALADRHSQIDRTDPAAKYVAEAFRSWAFCFVKGAPAPELETNLSRAAVLFYQAGVILDDAESLYELAKMHLRGQGITQNSRLAIHYFFNAARKRYAPAQAMLGSLLWDGKYLKRQSAPGLALIMMGLEGARAEDKKWIEGVYQEALLTASKDEEESAVQLFRDWKRAYNAEPTASTPAIVATPQVPPPVRAPGAPNAAPRQLATPGAIKRPEEQTEFGTTPTGADIPPIVSPVEE